MNGNKKLLVSAGWIALSALAAGLFPYLRQIGTTWMNNPGFWRLIGLAVFCVVLIAVPVVMAALAWVEQPKVLYKKFGSK